MTGIDTRNRTRETLFVFAEVRQDNRLDAHRVRVRNLSTSGMMGAGDLRVLPGSKLSISFRGTDPITGHVAWVQDDRFGVAFDEEIDAEKVKHLNSNFETQGAPDGAIVPGRQAQPLSEDKHPV